MMNGDPVARVPVAVSDDSMKCYNFRPDRSAGCALGFCAPQRLRRPFVQGIHERWELNLNKHIEWWWSVPVSPMMVWFLTTCVATAAVGVAMAMLTLAPQGQEEPQES